MPIIIKLKKVGEQWINSRKWSIITNNSDSESNTDDDGGNGGINNSLDDEAECTMMMLMMNWCEYHHEHWQEYLFITYINCCLPINIGTHPQLATQSNSMMNYQDLYFMK